VGGFVGFFFFVNDRKSYQLTNCKEKLEKKIMGVNGKDQNPPTGRQHFYERGRGGEKKIKLIG